MKSIKKKGTLKRIAMNLLCAVLLFNACAVALTSCGRKDELGNSYSDRIDGKDEANALLNGAKEKSDAISDIAYDIALMIKADDGAETYDLGIKNSYTATDRGTEESEVYCSKTYYGVGGNRVNVYYRHEGYLYIDFCNTMIRSEVSEKDFYTVIAKKGDNATTEFFKPQHFNDGCVYRYSDGRSAAVYTSPSDELKRQIAIFLEIEGVYMYDFSDVYLRCNVNVDGTVSDCRLDFMLNYYELMKPEAVVTYDGEFACTVNTVGDAVSVRTPQSGVEYATVSEFSKLELLLDAYSVLADNSNVSATYYRKVSNRDYSGNLYELEKKANYTQSYLDKVYTYGGIDEERGHVIKVSGENGTEKDEESTVTSVGEFVLADGSYKYRDLEGGTNEQRAEWNTDQWLANLALSLTEEAFYEDDLAGIKITEDEDTITFTYEYSQEVLNDYATYLLETFVSQQGSVNIGSMVVTPSRNKGTVKIRLSDGCLIYHKVEFEALIGYAVSVSGDYVLEINSTDEGIDVLDVEDWEYHEMKFN